MNSRRYLRAAKAAMELGIGIELLHGLIEGKQIDGFREPGRSGGYVWFIYADELDRVKTMIGAP